MSFIHLQISTAFSLLTSTVSIKKLVEQAVKYKYQTLAITDRNVLYGVIPFYKECVQNGIKPIIGLTADVLSETKEIKSFPMVLLAKNEKGYENLMKISSAIQTVSPTGIPPKWLRGYREGLFAFSPGIEGEIEALLLENDTEKALETAKFYQQLFEANSFFLSLQNHLLPENQLINQKLKEIGRELGIQTIVSNNVKYIEKEDAFSHECLLAIGEGLKLSDETRTTLRSEEYYFKSKEEMVQLFADEVDSLENTIRLAESCKLEIKMEQRLLPKFPLEENQTTDDLLRELCLHGLKERIVNINSTYLERLNYELKIIGRMQFNDYFLIVWDFMRFARQNDILTGPGRGSAAGSLVAYTLNITDVDPIEHELLFERFLNPERITMPDIDIDFPDHRRDEVIRYVAEKYGKLHVAQILTFGTLAAKAAVRDVARVFGFNTKELEQLSRLIPSKPGTTLNGAYQQSEKLRSFVQQSEQHKKLFSTALKLEGLPRHTSTHAAGVVISDKPLINIIPIQEGHDGVHLTQFPMDILEEIGLLKMDFLGLRNLSLIERIVTSINKGIGTKIDIKKLPLSDEKTFELLSKGNTTGIFQLESDGMRSVLERLKPSNFEDIVAVNALYRPGPMENIPTYIKRKHGEEPIQYPHPDLEPILKKTYGVIVYQEQIMQIASIMAGFSLGEADLLRRAVSKKKKEVLDTERAHFVKGAIAKGYDSRTANELYDLIVRFANYGFNRSHAVAYSYIAYQLAYLKAHYPLYFMSALLTSAIGNEDKISQYIREARQMGIRILPPSINHSYYPFVVEKGCIRYSLAAIKGVGMASLKEIMEARQAKIFADLFDLCIRVSGKALNRKVLESLVFAGALDDFREDRATLLASLDIAIDHAALVKPEIQGYDLFSEDEIFQLKPKYMEVEEMKIMDKLLFEKQVLGLYLSDHPVSPYREMLENIGVTYLVDVKKGQKHSKFAVYIHEFKSIRTKKGEVMGFLEISDATEELDAVIFPNVYRKYSNVCKQGQIAVLEGDVEERNGKLQIIVQKIKDIDEIVKNYQYKKEKLYLRFSNDINSTTVIKNVKKIISEFPGETPVVVYYETNNRTVQLTKKEWVNGSEECLLLLKELLGDGNVILQ
ncbi:DNA polymerase III subunit alpha [Bacillus sp. FJAT-49736]|uniref:DNA polymerase III subunit alpha n=1 Tax=Bacillus sp. FJAT-49736 TaxID=2833582 RepID=UPI001BC91A11|nr:DNA polymerase III subunit alpha [Bacillus sp. FJAT-49736]MBS4173800.1 DNA polymerase III subunit alpha [Bacillus sp. FJAT-49736]